MAAGVQADARASSMTSNRLARALVRMAGLVIGLLMLTAAAISVHAVWLDRWAALPGPAETIVVLGGGVRADGAPGPDSLRRVQQGIALWEAGLAPQILFTGGHRNPDVTGLADGMARVALDAGVPDSAITTENASRSTLQNALFSTEIVPPAAAGPVILVSDGYHLARAWASFRWAGYDPVSLSASSGFGGGTPGEMARRVGRETLAWWFNAGRVALWASMDLIGIETEGHKDLLA